MEPGKGQIKSDWSEFSDLQRRLTEVADKLSAQAGDEAMARQVLEYDSDRRKRALAISMTPLVKAGASAAAAEAEARAGELYGAAINQLRKEFTAAQKTHLEWEALKIQWETARSLLSMCRATIGNV